MAKTYSHDLKVGDRLDKLSDSAMKATDEGFYGTASVKELVGWKISKVFRETKDVAEDKIYGGFCYMIATKDDQMIMAFRGSFGDRNISVEDKRGDWYRNFNVFPFQNDPDGTNAEITALEVMGKYTSEKIYITGHSRGGMLAQRALYRMIKIGKDSNVGNLTYFNGLGCVFRLIGDEAIDVSMQLKKSSGKIYNKKIEGDIVSWSFLGHHVVEPTFFKMLEVAKKNVRECPEHAMCNFTGQIMNGIR